MNTVLTKAFLGNTANQFRFSGFNISIVDYTQKVSEEWHYHENIHLSSIISGGNLESRKAEDVQVKPGKIMVYEQGEVHRNRFTAHPSRNLNIEFGQGFFDDEMRFSQLQTEENTNVAFLKIYLELMLNDNCSENNIEQIVKSLFWTDAHDSQGVWIPKLKELLHDRWNQFPSLDELSNELRVHPVTISKYFAKHGGMTVSEYMRKIKVKRAVELLINSSKTYVEIAMACGFSDQSHMNRLVKKYTGHVPGTIRSLL